MKFKKRIESNSYLIYMEGDNAYLSVLITKTVPSKGRRGENFTALSMKCSSQVCKVCNGMEQFIKT